MSGAATPRNILTVDLEEWFHLDEAVIPPGEWDRLPSRVEANMRVLLDLFDEAGVRATVFVLGWVAARQQRLVRDIAARGHELATHGYLHRSVSQMTTQEFRADLRQARQAIEAAADASLTGYRAPRWSLGGRPGGGRRGHASGVVIGALDVLIEEGMRYDASLAPIVSIGDSAWPRDPYRIERPAGSIVELPPLVGRFFGVPLLFAGGFALRCLPARAILREVARRNTRGAPAVIDLHPWELDDDPPRAAMPLKYRIAHHAGLRGFRARLRDLLPRLDAGPACDWLAASASSPPAYPG